MVFGFETPSLSEDAVTTEDAGELDEFGGASTETLRAFETASQAEAAEYNPDITRPEGDDVAAIQEAIPGISPDGSDGGSGGGSDSTEQPDGSGGESGGDGFLGGGLGGFGGFIPFPVPSGGNGSGGGSGGGYGVGLKDILAIMSGGMSNTGGGKKKGKDDGGIISKIGTAGVLGLAAVAAVLGYALSQG